MSLNLPYMGEGYVPAYQVAPSPYVTSSNVNLGEVKQINFNGVTKYITVKNNSASSSVLALGFTQNGLTAANSNFFVISGSQNLTVELRVDRIFISGSAGISNFSVLAGVTNIPVANFLTVTGSNNFAGVG